MEEIGKLISINIGELAVHKVSKIAKKVSNKWSIYTTDAVMDTNQFSSALMAGADISVKVSWKFSSQENHTFLHELRTIHCITRLNRPTKGGFRMYR